MFRTVLSRTIAARLMIRTLRMIQRRRCIVVLSMPAFWEREAGAARSHADPRLNDTRHDRIANSALRVHAARTVCAWPVVPLVSAPADMRSSDGPGTP